MASQNVQMNMSVSPANNPDIRSEQDFPALGTSPLKTLTLGQLADSGAKLPTHNKKQRRRNRPQKLTKFIVASSRIDELRQQSAARYNRRDVTVSPEQKARDAAFARLENKEEMAKSLKATKPCRNVTEPQKGALMTRDGKYGVCTREVCTFAHSLAELQDPKCSFGAGCRYIRGRRTRDGRFDKARKCKFRHPKEDRDTYLKRIGKTLPDLPLQSYDTRKARKSTPQRPRVVPRDVPTSPTWKPIEHKPLVAKLDIPPAELPTDNEESEDEDEDIKILLDRPQTPPKSGFGRRGPSRFSEPPLEPEETVLRVPKDKYEETLMMVIGNGLSGKFRVEIAE